ncbi:MAG: hypothetical protein U0Q47_02125 [Mycobacterium sp.]
MAALSATVLLAAGCGGTVTGSATWPGATLNKVTLSATDFPPGVQFDRIVDRPGVPDGAGAPPSMLSRPEGCANALTNVIAESAERGPGSAAKYSVGYDGARIVMTVLSWRLDLAKLEAAAVRCANFEAFFDARAEGIPITTTELSGVEKGALAYQQTMRLDGSPSSVYMAFMNVGNLALFGIAFPTPDPRIEAKASLPQTFLDVVAKQAAKIRAT